MPQGVCSRMMTVELDKEGRIVDVSILGGCAGNLLGLSAMCKGQPADEVIDKLRGIRCGAKATSCPDQMAIAIERALREQADKSDIA